MTINEDSNMSFPDNSNFSQSQDQDSTEADMRLGRLSKHIMGFETS